MNWMRAHTVPVQEKLAGGYAAWADAKSARTECIEELLRNYSVHYGNETPALIESVPEEILHLVHPHWYQYPAPDPVWNLGFAVIYLILGTLAFLGNSLVLVLFGRRHSARTGIDVLTANLALADLLMACSQFPILVVNSLNGRWTMGPIVCKLYGFCGALCGTVSIVTMALIALDRYFAIVHPFSGLSFSSARGYRWAVHTWIYAISWCIPPFWGWNSYVPEGFMTHCGFDFISSDCWSRAYVILLCLAAYFLPLFVIIFCYIHIFQHVVEHETDMRNQAKKMNMDSSSTTTIGSFRKEKELAKIAFAIISLWLFAWTPYTVVSIMGLLSQHSYLTPLGTMIPALCAKTASLYNPIVYALMHPKYKQELYFLCPKIMPTRLHHRASTTSSRSFVSRTVSTDYDKKSIASRTASYDTGYGPRSPAIRSVRGVEQSKQNHFTFEKNDPLVRKADSLTKSPEAVTKQTLGIPATEALKMNGSPFVTPTLQRKPGLYRKTKETGSDPIVIAPPFMPLKTGRGSFKGESCTVKVECTRSTGGSVKSLDTKVHSTSEFNSLGNLDSV